MNILQFSYSANLSHTIHSMNNLPQSNLSQAVILILRKLMSPMDREEKAPERKKQIYFVNIILGTF